MHLTPDQLVDLAEGAQTDGAAHAQSCEQCRVELAALKAALAAASDVEVPEPSPLFWAHLSARVREGVAGEAASAAPSRWRMPSRPSWSAAALGVAAAVALAVYVTAPREGPAFEPPPAAADIAAELVIQPFGAADDPSLTLVAALTGQLDPDAVNDAGWTNHAGGVEEVVANLTEDERLELQRLLKEALEKRDAS
jgi:hypothetical protein